MNYFSVTLRFLLGLAMCLVPRTGLCSMRRLAARAQNLVLVMTNSIVKMAQYDSEILPSYLYGILYYLGL